MTARGDAGAAAASPPILYRVEGGTAYLTINRPQVLNAMDSHAHLAFSEALDEADADEAVRVVVVAGSGDKAFSVGRDLGEIARTPGMTPDESEELEARWRRVRRLTDRHDFPKPTIAVVQGYAFGGGFEIALSCDIVLATPSGRFALPEPKRGLIASAGGIHRLPRQIPLKVAMGHLLTGRAMDAPRAYELGLVNEIVEPERLDQILAGWISDILDCAPLSLQATKEGAMRGLGQPLSAAIADRYPAVERWRTSSDAQEGAVAFTEKRKPLWKGV